MKPKFKTGDILTPCATLNEEDISLKFQIINVSRKYYKMTCIKNINPFSKMLLGESEDYFIDTVDRMWHKIGRVVNYNIYWAELNKI